MIHNNVSQPLMLHPIEHVTISANYSDYHIENGEKGAIVNWWLNIQDVTTYPIMHRTVPEWKLNFNWKKKYPPDF